MEKAHLRARIRQTLNGIPPTNRTEFAERASRNLLRQPAWHNSNAILGFLALKDELDLFRVLEAAWATGKIIALPRYVPERNAYCAAVTSPEKREFVKGAFGVLEPPADAPLIPLNRLDLVLVPGLAFDCQGRRLGRGRGFYDRLLAEVTGIKCGVALDEQIVEELPEEPHDIAMNFILTPTRWIEVKTPLAES
jgi:5-formyltetrahydrofolate cyclo-ligase